MAKIDEIKEILNSLRVAMSIAFGVFVLILGKILSMYTDNQIIDIFWLAIAAAIINLAVIFVIIRQITKKTREIRDL